MKLVINYASIENKKKMIIPYFNFYNAFYGEEMVTRAIYRRLYMGKPINPLLEGLSSNYRQTLDTIDDSIADDKDLCMLEVTDGEAIDPETGKPQVLAYARFSWALEYGPITESQKPYYEEIDEFGVPDYEEEDSEETIKEKNPKNAGVHDIALAVEMTESQAAEFYANFIIALEEWAKERNEMTELITHEVPSNNFAYLDAIFDNGEYNTVEKNDFPRIHTIMFDKWVRNKPLTRVRVPKQDKEK